MGACCPHCNSSDLKKVSLTYRKGAYRIDARTRLAGFLIGSDGPDLFAGRARTKGFHKSELSTLLNPPVKWSYGKLLLWAGIFSMLALIAFVIHVNSSPPPVSSWPVDAYAAIAPIILALLAVAFWRHNSITYRAEYHRWERSYICQQCGMISEHNLRGNPVVKI